MTDIGFQNFLITPDRYKWIDYLNPYARESICFMAPKTIPGFTQIFETMYHAVMTMSMELAKVEVLKFLEEFKLEKEITKELLVNVAKCSLNTKIHPDLGNPLCEILVDAVDTIRKSPKALERNEIDLHMIEIMHM